MNHGGGDIPLTSGTGGNITVHGCVLIPQPRYGRIPAWLGRSLIALLPSWEILSVCVRYRKAVVMWVSFI